MEFVRKDSHLFSRIEIQIWSNIQETCLVGTPIRGLFCTSMPLLVVHALGQILFVSFVTEQYATRVFKHYERITTLWNVILTFEHWIQHSWKMCCLPVVTFSNVYRFKSQEKASNLKMKRWTDSKIRKSVCKV